jgi:pyroglutamyl-peptidase
MCDHETHDTSSFQFTLFSAAIMDSHTADASSPEVSFIVTGFGPFQDAKVNPTMILAHKLVEYLKAKEAAKPSHLPCGVPLSSMTQTLVIETSANAVQQEMDALNDQIAKQGQDNKVVVLLHLGVNYRGTIFQVESCAYNEADFRIPDERGYQPRNKAIVDAYPVGATLNTLLDVPALVTFLNATDNHSGADEEEEVKHKNLRSVAKNNNTPFVMAKSSIDPGRFVCNYVYCYSLDKFQCSHLAAVAATSTTTDSDTSPPVAAKKESNVRCLFLHVPPFAVVSEGEQLRVVSNLMVALYQQVRVQIQVQSEAAI